MSTTRIVHVFAGTMIVVSILLAVYHDLNWLWLTGFVGANLFQWGFTEACPLEVVLKKLGVASCPTDRRTT